MKKIEFEKKLEEAFGPQWEAKVGTVESHLRFGRYWTYAGHYEKNGQRVESPLTKYNQVFDGCTNAAELAAAIEKDRRAKPYGFGLTKREFAELYFRDSLEMGRLSGMDGPFDWCPRLLAPKESQWLEALKKISLEASLALSGGICNTFQRRAASDSAFSAAGISPSKHDGLGGLYPRHEWEEAWLRLCAPRVAAWMRI